MKKRLIFILYAHSIRVFLILVTGIVFLRNVKGQEKVSFFSEDSLKITADLYLKDYNLPFILLFHQEDASRGEYNEIATRLEKLDYNCLAVDLRAGEKMNYVQNESAERAKSGRKPHTLSDAKRDIEASAISENLILNRLYYLEVHIQPRLA